MNCPVCGNNAMDLWNVLSMAQIPAEALDVPDRSGMMTLTRFEITARCMACHTRIKLDIPASAVKRMREGDELASIVEVGRQEFEKHAAGTFRHGSIMPGKRTPTTIHPLPPVTIEWDSH